jgi:photosystem I protein PsaO
VPPPGCHFFFSRAPLSHAPPPSPHPTTTHQSYGGGSLFGAFTSTIGTELAKFPAGPSIDSPFWLQLIVFHVGLFVCMTLAQIGVQGRKQGYF